MLLLDIEKEIRPLSYQEKLTLIQDIEQMLEEEHLSTRDMELRKYFPSDQAVGAYGPVNEPEIARQLQKLLSS